MLFVLNICSTLFDLCVDPVNCRNFCIWLQKTASIVLYGRGKSLHVHHFESGRMAGGDASVNVAPVSAANGAGASRGIFKNTNQNGIAAMTRLKYNSRIFWLICVFCTKNICLYIKPFSLQATLSDTEKFSRLVCMLRRRCGDKRQRGDAARPLWPPKDELVCWRATRLSLTVARHLLAR